MMTGMLYHFPRARFVDENGIYGQVSHINSEATEAAAELGNPDIQFVAMEVMDVYHSAETALRILEEKYGVDIKALMFKVAAKNEERGYYK
jgi:hypothetical protein